MQAYIARYLFLISLVVPSFVWADVLANGLWSAKRVDWHVTKHETQDKQRSYCVVHWVYDNAYDLALQDQSATTEDLNLYFSIDVLMQDLSEGLSLGAGNTYQANLITNLGEYPIIAEAINSKTLILPLPKALNSGDELALMKHLTVFANEIVYRFPLTNAFENVNVFKNCSQDIQPVSAEGAEAALEKEKPRKKLKIDPEPFKLSVSEEVEATDEGGGDGIAVPLPPSKTPPPPNVDDRPSSKAADRMLEDARYSVESGVADAVNSAYDNTYSAMKRETSVINNLTRKLALLEAEKEELRMKLLNIGDDRVISDLVACKPKAPLVDKFEPDKKVLAKFEEVIANLRAENEVLKSSLSANAPSQNIDNGESALEVSGLKQQIEALKERNSVLNNDLAEYQERFEAFSETLDPDDEPVSDADSVASGQSIDGEVPDSSN